MGVDFYLACGNCREFICLHKWPVVDRAGDFLVNAHYEPGKYPGQLRPEDSPFPFVDLETDFKKLLITAEQIEDALAFYVPEWPYIAELTPIVRDFAVRHRSHQLFLACDLGGDEPWWPGEPWFEAWLSVPGPCQAFRFLPRNLVEVASFQTWQEASSAMARELVLFEDTDIEVIRLSFERLVARRRESEGRS